MRQLVNQALVLVIVLGLAPSQARAQAATGEQPDAYGIQPGDTLSIAVWNEEAMNREVLVRPDGGISYPLAGDMQVRGLTVVAVQAVIAERLQQYIPDPVVSVAVQQTQGNAIYVLGKVNRPGPYVMAGRTDVMQALSLAGGTSTFAALGKIKILRRNAGGQTAIPFDYSEVEQGRGLEQNIVLQAGDVVVVP